MLSEDQQTRSYDVPIHLVEVIGKRPGDPWAQHNFPPVCRGVGGTYRQGLHQVRVSIAVVSGERYAVHRIPLRLRCTKHKPNTGAWREEGAWSRGAQYCQSLIIIKLLHHYSHNIATFVPFSVRNANSNGPTFKVISAPSRFAQCRVLQRLFTHLP